MSSRDLHGSEDIGTSRMTGDPERPRHAGDEERGLRTNEAARPTRPDGGTHADPDDRLSASPPPLFPEGEEDGFRSRWREIQTNFVDEPQQAVREADRLVKEVTDRLVSVFTDNRDDLERRWNQGDEVSTEDLRQTLQQYRSFFERLLSV